MVEQNAWRNYQTKLLGGGLLLIAIIIIAALLSHSNHTTPIQQEVELTLQPQPVKPDANEEPIAQSNPTPPVSSIEISKVNANHAIQTTKSPAMLPIAPKPVTVAAQNKEAIPQQPPAVTQVKSVVTTTHATPTPHIKTVVEHNTKAKPHKQNTAKPSLVANKETKQRLLAISKSHYTIQLLGVSSKQNALQFINRNHLKQKAIYYSTLNHGKPWHVVIYGNFQTKAQAHAALHKLPQALLKIKPFVRSYAEVHAALLSR